LPVFGAFRAPARFTVMLDFALAALAALGLELACAATPAARRVRRGLAAAALLGGVVLALVRSASFRDDAPWLALLLGCAAWLALAGACPRPAWDALGVALLAGDVLVYAGHAHEPSLVAAQLALSRAPLLARLAAPPGRERVYVCTGPQPWLLESNRALVYG